MPRLAPCPSWEITAASAFEPNRELDVLFDRPSVALKASNDIFERLQSADVILPSDRDRLSRILNVQNEGIFGNKVKFASKSGGNPA
jgi:hypothetical protein